MKYPATLTPEMTLGPFFPRQLLNRKSNCLSGCEAMHPEEKIFLFGCVYDRYRQGVSRCLLEIVGINNRVNNNAAHQSSCSMVRTLTDDNGCYRFFVCKPAQTSIQAYLQLTLFCSGINRLFTSVYFARDLSDRCDLTISGTVDSRQALLFARPGKAKKVPSGWEGYRFDVRLRGENETPFFANNTVQKPFGYTRVDAYNRVRISAGDTHSMARTPAKPLLNVADHHEPMGNPACFSVHPHEYDLTGLCEQKGRARGDYIHVHGRVLNQMGSPLPGQFIEMWAANCYGQYVHEISAKENRDPHFAGFGRTCTDTQGNYRFITPKPGAYLASETINWWRPPHLHLSLLGRGTRLVTQMLFPGDPLNARDLTLQTLPNAAVQARVIAKLLGVKQGANGKTLQHYRFDITVWDPLA